MATAYREDIEDIDYAVQENSINFLEKKQRELITSTVDYNLESLSQLINKRIIDLAPKYQRRFRWDTTRKSKLIESFLMNVPVPPIFLNEDDLGKYSVIDGKQRLAAINEFIGGKFHIDGLEVFQDLNGKNFFDLPVEFQNSLKIRANLRAIIILRQSDKDIKYEVFQRLNTGGVKLNSQEIRNSAFPGQLNDKILDLSESKNFHKLLGIKSKNSSGIYQEMKDAELVLRFFALKDDWKNYNGNLKKILDTYMDTNKNLTSDKVKALENDFLSTLDNVEVIFGNDGSFRRWLPQNNRWKQKVSAPIFDAQMFSCYRKDKKKLEENRKKILDDFKELFNNDKTFTDALEFATGNSSKLIYRIVKLNDIINKYL